MKKRDRMERDRAAGKAELLCEALPWINKMSGKTFVIKYGGSAMEDPELCRQVVADIEMLKLMGVRIVLVHGGGKAINAMLKRLDVPVKFKDGLRVTDDETMEAVQEVLVGHVNQQLVWALNEYGHNAVGISGADGKTLKAEPVDPDLGRVGRIREVDTSLINTIQDDGYIPVVATVGCGPDGFYNEWADSGNYYVDFDISTDHIYKATGDDNENSMDTLVIGENYWNEETLGKLTIRKTGNALTGMIETIDLIDPWMTGEADSDFAYTLRPLAGAEYTITAAEDIYT